MTDFGDRVAREVFRRFDALPPKCKPFGAGDGDGGRKWVPLSGIVLSENSDASLECVALAWGSSIFWCLSFSNILRSTGMKCLPASKVRKANGCVLHDWHAETLVIRAFNAFLIGECHKVVRLGESASKYVRVRSELEMQENSGLQPFSVRIHIKIHMYCSEVPCGDASMELNMDAQEDAAPWKLPQPTGPHSGEAILLHGRGYYSELGVVRSKPARADSPPTLSKSCSDKMAMKQFTSLLSSVTCLLINSENAYISSVVFPSCQYVELACKRSFSSKGRLSPLVGKDWLGGYAFHPFDIKTTSIEFSHSRRVAGSKGSNLSVIWTPGMQEILVNGVLQGRKQSDPRGASGVSRKKLWDASREVLRLAAGCAAGSVLSTRAYSNMKETRLLYDRRRVKQDVKENALKGWILNDVDDFEINTDVT